VTAGATDRTERIRLAADRLRTAPANGTPARPVRDQLGTADTALACSVQQQLAVARIADGAHVIGRKIGLTSLAVHQQLGVDQPDFGMLFDDMLVAEGDVAPVRRLLEPKIEAWIAFVLWAELDRPVNFEDFIVDIALDRQAETEPDRAPVASS
jgi:2-keto-4-pentenoate hydratase